MPDNILLNLDHCGVATLTLNREDKHNAFDDAIIAELTAKLGQADADPQVRAVVLAAVGKTFSAGGDLAWMRSMAHYSEKQNLEDALKLAELMETLDGLSKPTIARVNGPAYGGGVGLVACCDIAIAIPSAKFALTEVRLGLVPSVISPYVIAAIGAREARRYFLTAEAIDAEDALRIGLIHQLVTPDILDETVGMVVNALLKAGPEASRCAKRLVAEQSGAEGRADKRRTAQLIAQLRVSPEGQEGLSAFLEKRNPNWIK